MTEFIAVTYHVLCTQHALTIATGLMLSMITEYPNVF